MALETYGLPCVVRAFRSVSVVGLARSRYRALTLKRSLSLISVAEELLGWLLCFGGGRNRLRASACRSLIDVRLGIALT